MVGAGAVVAERFHRIVAEEHRAGVADLRHQRARVFGADLKMLWRDVAGDLASLVETAHQYQRPAIGQRGADGRRARHGRQQLFDAVGHAFEKVSVRTQQDGLRQLIVLGLREEVHRYPVRVAVAVGDDEHLGGAGDHIDAHRAEHAALGRGDVGVTGTRDLVDLRDGLRAIRQRADRLRAADGEDAVDAGHSRSGQHQRVLLAARGRHDHDQLTHPGDLGRDRVHHHARRVGRLATRHVKTRAIQGGHLLAQHGAVGLGVVPVGHQLALVVAADTLHREFKGLALGLGQRLEGAQQFGARQLQRGHVGRIEPVEAARVFEHGGVTLAPNAVEDAGNGGLDGVVGRGFEGEQGRQPAVEVGVAGVKSVDQGHVRRAPVRRQSNR